MFKIDHIDLEKLTDFGGVDLPLEDLECYKKLALVLLKMSRQELKTSDDTVLEKLMDFIRLLGNRSITDSTVLIPILCDWLKYMCVNWLFLPNDSKVFTLKVAAYVLSTPSGYESLSSNGCFAALLFHFHDPPGTKSFALSLGYIALMDAALGNEKGATLLLQSGFWDMVVVLALSTSNIYCARQSTKLIAKFIKIADDGTCQNIVSKISKSIVPKSVISQPEVFSEECYDLEQKISVDTSSKYDVIEEREKSCCLTTLRGVFTELMETDYPVDKLRCLMEHCNLLTAIEGIIRSSNHKEVLCEAIKLSCVLNCLTFYQAKDENGLLPQNVANCFIDKVLEHVNQLISRRLVHYLADANVEYQTLMHKFGSPVAGSQAVDALGKLNENVPSSVYNLLFLTQAVPMLMCLKARCLASSADVLDVYLDNICRKTDSKVMRYMYMFRGAFSRLGEDLGILSTEAVKRFTLLCPIMRREQGVMIFQAVVHVLEEFVGSYQNDGSRSSQASKPTFIEGDELIVKYPGLLSASLTCLHAYLTRFDFSWRDSLESLALLRILQNLLESSVVPNRSVVEILKAIDLVLLKFMPPNLALLVDTLKGSSIEELGAQLFRLLHSVDWAIRDSTLELVKTISSLSESRFPAFQTLLKDNRLPEVVFSLIESDYDPFVRATAISCLYELARVPNVWNVSFDDKIVIEKLLIIMHYETEGIVRVSAAKTIMALYNTRNLSPQLLEMIYDTMSHVAQNDLHWEVKVTCVDFWEGVMAKAATEQGLTDGVFPEAVFSKEKKKIIVLTENEIINRVVTCMSILGNVGCLQVLWDTFDNEPDLEVQRRSAMILNNMRSHPKLNLSSKAWESISKLLMEPHEEFDSTAPVQTVSCSPATEVIEETFQNVARSDEIIEQIVSEDDLSLLSSLVDESIKKKSLPPIKRIRMSHVDFMQKLHSVDINEIMRQRSDWLTHTSEGAESLLDDILLFSKKLETDNSTDTNAVDCY